MKLWGGKLGCKRESQRDRAATVKNRSSFHFWTIEENDQLTTVWYSELCMKYRLTKPSKICWYISTNPTELKKNDTWAVKCVKLTPIVHSHVWLCLFVCIWEKQTITSSYNGIFINNTSDAPWQWKQVNKRHYVAPAYFLYK